MINKLDLIEEHVLAVVYGIRHQGMKTTVLSCHRCLINIGVEKMNSFQT